MLQIFSNKVIVSTCNKKKEKKEKEGKKMSAKKYDLERTNINYHSCDENMKKRVNWKCVRKIRDLVF